MPSVIPIPIRGASTIKATVVTILPAERLGLLTGTTPAGCAEATLPGAYAAFVGTVLGHGGAPAGRYENTDDVNEPETVVAPHLEQKVADSGSSAAHREQFIRCSPLFCWLVQTTSTQYAPSFHHHYTASSFTIYPVAPDTGIFFTLKVFFQACSKITSSRVISFSLLYITARCVTNLHENHYV